MKVAKGKITTKKSGKGGYKSAWIYIPSKVYKDVLFPFQENEELMIEIEENSLVITKNGDNSKTEEIFDGESASTLNLSENTNLASENSKYDFLG